MFILEEGNLPLPQCPRCDLQVSRKALNGRHLETNQCKTGAERKLRRLAAAEGEAASKRAFHAYGNKMRAVTEFHYLGRVMTNTDDDWPAVAGNLRKARVTRRGMRPVSRRVTLPWNASRAASILLVRTKVSLKRRTYCVTAI